MSNQTNSDSAFLAAAELISQADGLLITSGAGMGIDSGMPDFRGVNGFWKAYPALQGLKMPFYEIASPKAFHAMPLVAWGFYGHRLALYRSIAPHAGFAMLSEIASQAPAGAFVFTSNVDGHFQKAGFDNDRVAECHGSIHTMQCLVRCGQPTWPADDVAPVVDAARCTLVSPLPLCPRCGGLARPNILMFGDYGWDARQTDQQLGRLQSWLGRLQQPVVIEIGAGTAIPTVRSFGERQRGPMIRINPFEARVKRPRDRSIALGALDGISRIARALNEIKGQV